MQNATHGARGAPRRFAVLDSKLRAARGRAASLRFRLRLPCAGGARAPHSPGRARVLGPRRAGVREAEAPRALGPDRLAPVALRGAELEEAVRELLHRLVALGLPHHLELLAPEAHVGRPVPHAPLLDLRLGVREALAELHVLLHRRPRPPPGPVLAPFRVLRARAQRPEEALPARQRARVGALAHRGLLRLAAEEAALGPAEGPVLGPGLVVRRRLHALVDVRLEGALLEV